MAYNYWKMMDRVGVAVCSERQTSYYGGEGFDGYIFEADDENARKTAEDWATRYDNRYDNDKETIIHEPNVHIFDNSGFTVTVLDSAGGSSHGGRLSFWKCRVEKDGVEFVVGVNDAILADLIRNSDMEKGKVKQGLMFVRKGGQPGFIHEGMDAYAEAVKDKNHKEAMKSAKKTSKWEIGGVYSTITQKSICIGEVWDHYEEKEVQDGRWSYYKRRTLVKRDKPVKVLAWMSYHEQHDGELDLNALLKRCLENRWRWFETGKPPARAKSEQLEVTEESLNLIDELLASREYSAGFDEPEIKGRYSRELK